MPQIVTIDSNNNVRVTDAGPIGPAGLPGLPGPPGPAALDPNEMAVVYALIDATLIDPMVLTLFIGMAVPSPAGLRIAMVNSGELDLDGIYEGTTTNPGDPETWGPVVRIEDLPDEMIFAPSFFNTTEQMLASTPLNGKFTGVSTSTTPSGPWSVFEDYSETPFIQAYPKTHLVGYEYGFEKTPTAWGPNEAFAPNHTFGHLIRVDEPVLIDQIRLCGNDGGDTGAQFHFGLFEIDYGVLGTTALIEDTVVAPASEDWMLLSGDPAAALYPEKAYALLWQTDSALAVLHTNTATPGIEYGTYLSNAATRLSSNSSTFPTFSSAISGQSGARPFALFRVSGYPTGGA